VIKVRKLHFEFGDDIPFWFNPRSREASLLVTGMSLIAPAFERYFIKAIREAMPQIRDAAAREEANRFCIQEGQHAKFHIDHQELLLRKHPALEAVRDEVNRSYDNLQRGESTEFALAYATTIELGFKPLARYLVENRHALFADGDPRIASFILWHFVEEFEHRHAMFDVYQEVVGDYWYRLKIARRTYAHVTGLGAVMQSACIACEEPPVDDPPRARIPRRRKVALAFGLLETLSPFHDPRRGSVPQWITDWFGADAAGADMTSVSL
jgi:predicted metal-dependent hydrolase